MYIMDKNRIITIVLSIIWGFGLAILFRKTCKNDQCVIIKVPPELAQTNNKIKDKNGHCYFLHSYRSECD